MNWAENRINELKTELMRTNNAISHHESEVSHLEETVLRIAGAIAVLEEQMQAEAESCKEGEPVALGG
jgi:predicted  nucleic acid-binding Zn-ribbon protein